MWEPAYFGYSEPSFIYQYVADLDNGCSLQVTDLKRLYTETLTLDQMLERYKDMNPGLELTTDLLHELVEKVMPTLRIGEITHNRLYLRGTRRIVEVPFNWFFNLTVETPEVLAETIYHPLLRLTTALFIRQEFLYKMIEAKDREIEDYRHSGASLSRDYLATSPFDRESFRKESLDLKPLGTCLNSVFCQNWEFFHKCLSFKAKPVSVEESEGGGDNKPSCSTSASNADSHNINETNDKEEDQKRRLELSAQSAQTDLSVKSAHNAPGSKVKKKKKKINL